MLTEIALQVKGNLAFLLGLGGMFAIVKALLMGLVVLPKIKSDRPSVEVKAKTLSWQLSGCALVSVVLFIAAVWAYFSSPMASIDLDALKKGNAPLTVPQQWATGILTFAAVGLVVIESIASVLRYRFNLLSQIK